MRQLLRISIATATALAAAVGVVAASSASSAVLPPAPGSADTTPGTDPADGEDTTPPPDRTDGTDATAAEPVTIFSADGEVGTIAVVDVEPNWSEYGSDDTPEQGEAYLRVTVEVVSTAPDDDTFDVAVDDFILQDRWGGVRTAENIPTAAEADADAEVVGQAELASGESIELALTFPILMVAEPHWVFYRPSDVHLVHLVNVGDVVGDDDTDDDDETD